MLLAWSLTFRCSRTFQNYLNYVRSAGLLHGFSDDVFSSSALRRAKVAIDKRQLWKPRPKMWIGQEQLQHVMTLLVDSPGWRPTALWMLAAYVFKLRVPSECLPMVVGVGDNTTFGQEQPSQSIIYPGSDEIVLCLKRRKNRCDKCHYSSIAPFSLCNVVGHGVQDFAGPAGARNVPSHAQSTYWVQDLWPTVLVQCHLKASMVERPWPT